MLRAQRKIPEAAGPRGAKDSGYFREAIAIFELPQCEPRLVSHGLRLKRADDMTPSQMGQHEFDSFPPAIFAASTASLPCLFWGRVWTDRST